MTQQKNRLEGRATGANGLTKHLPTGFALKGQCRFDAGMILYSQEPEVHRACPQVLMEDRRHIAFFMAML